MREPGLSGTHGFSGVPHIFIFIFIIFLVFQRVLMQSPALKEKAQDLLWHVHSSGNVKNAAITACFDLHPGGLGFQQKRGLKNTLPRTS